MIGRVMATLGAIIPVAAAAAVTNGSDSVTVQAPVVWSVLGERFEAASMIAALFGCLAARFWIGAGQQMRKEHRWSIDVPVSAMALGFTATLVMLEQPAPFGGLLYGAGAGVLGEGIFKLAERYMAKAMAVLGTDTGTDDGPAPAPALRSAADPDAVKGIGQALQRLHKPPNP